MKQNTNMKPVLENLHVKELGKIFLQIFHTDLMDKS